MTWTDKSSYWKVFLKLLSPGLGESVLDVGAGRGTVASRVIDRPERPDVWTIEPVRERAHRAHSDFPDLKLFVGAAEELPFRDAHFDKVYATLSMHHFADMRAALSEVARVTKARGTFVVVEVNPHSAKGVFFRVIGRLTGENMRFMTMSQLTEAVRSVGSFEVSQTCAMGPFHFLQATRT